MRAVNGSVRATFVAEVGGPEGLYLARAVCTRCVPEYRGEVRRGVGPQGVAAAQLEATRDVLRHADRMHDGKLIGR
jgi:hypothetical protein